MEFKNSKAIGEFGELKIALRLIEIGCSISIPFGNNQRYDMIADYKGKLFKVQCKTTSIDKRGRITPKLTSTTMMPKPGCKVEYVNKKYSVEEVDIFCVYCLDNDKVYIIPSSINNISMRIEKPANSQIKKIHYAWEYEACQARIDLFL